MPCVLMLALSAESSSSSKPLRGWKGLCSITSTATCVWPFTGAVSASPPPSRASSPRPSRDFFSMRFLPLFHSSHPLHAGSARRRHHSSKATRAATGNSCQGSEVGGQQAHGEERGWAAFAMVPIRRAAGVSRLMRCIIRLTPAARQDEESRCGRCTAALGLAARRLHPHPVLRSPLRLLRLRHRCPSGPSHRAVSRRSGSRNGDARHPTADVDAVHRRRHAEPSQRRAAGSIARFDPALAAGPGRRRIQRRGQPGRPRRRQGRRPCRPRRHPRQPRSASPFTRACWTYSIGDTCPRRCRKRWN